jgi:superfamily II DNA or RNA helicase
MLLKDLTPGTVVEGLVPGRPVTVVGVTPHGAVGSTIVFRDESTGAVDQRLVFASDEHNLRIISGGRTWAFDGAGDLFRLASEAHRIRLAYLFDPLLAVHISNVEPLPHQIAAVYEEMLRRQPLRYLLADDPGAGKTIMAGLFIRELMLRGDLERCLVVCPANLAEQWQDELLDKFRLNFAIVDRGMIESSAVNNPFSEKDLLIGRIDLLKTDDNMARLEAAEWDLVVVDEAHKMSATFFGGEVTYTARYRLGELLGKQARHLLLMTATPHRGKEEDFQLFLGLIDADRFEGKYREGVHSVDTSDIMRRMLKEELVDFEGRPLFPDRRAYTVNYELSDDEALLYEAVTKYVTQEMDRAEQLAREDGGERRKTVVGFALTILQRRLASSPAAIHESLKRRMKRLEQRLEEAKQAKRVADVEEESPLFDVGVRGRVNIEDLEDDLDEKPETEAQDIVDLATAARTVTELAHEVESLRRLSDMAERVRDSGKDRKWEQLGNVLHYPEMFDERGGRRKLVIFTEHRDTLNYLAGKIKDTLGQEAVVEIHGSLLRGARREAQARFLNHPDAKVLVATDAAGEGVNLQRAHLMVNYDLPWNPNRIEQRFGRIHRFGQKEVCHLWNLVAHQTREGAVYQRLFEKLEQERAALGGKVFDVLGRAFTEVALRELMLEAIHYNTTEEAREWLTKKIDSKWDAEFLKGLIDDYALDATTMSSVHLLKIKEDMDRAEAKRLVPHFIASFFVEGFTRLGGVIREREKGRYEIRRVPADLRRRDRVIGHGEPLLGSYERICFDKSEVDVAGKPPAAFVAPGHPLLDTVIDILLERYRDLLRRGAVLIDDSDTSDGARVMFSVESDITDGRTTREGNRRVVSRQLDFIEVGADDKAVLAGAAPYLDYRQATEQEMTVAAPFLQDGWLSRDLEEMARQHAIETVVGQHFERARQQREELVRKTMAAVKDRLTKEVQYWDHRAEELKLQELAGKTPRINSGNARRRAEDLEARLEVRMKELEQERDLSPLPPVVTAGALVIPARMLSPSAEPGRDGDAADNAARARIEAVAMEAVLTSERREGRLPVDVSKQNRGWDIESRDPDEGHIRFIEVKGRYPDAVTVCVTKNEWLTSLNKRQDFYLAIVSVDGDKAVNVAMIPDPVQGDPQFGVTSVNLAIADLVARTKN